MWGALEDGRFANRPYEEGLWGRKRGMGPRLREDTGRERRGWLWGAIDSSLRYVQNDMWGALRSE